MVKRYCDRCGAVIDKSYYIQKFDPPSYQVTKIFDFGGSIKVDLCGSCQKNLDATINEWMKNSSKNPET